MRGKENLAVSRGKLRLARFLRKPEHEQDAILRVAMQLAERDAAEEPGDDDWQSFDGASNWIDRF